MDETILALFSSQKEADQAIASLKDSGYATEDFSVITRDAVIEGEASTKGENAAEGAVSGIATGGGIGAIAGLLIGLGAITIPGIGAIIVGGPLAVALGLTGAAAATATGALTGALAGGLVGALVGLGVPEEIAKTYEKRISEGATLLAIPTHSKMDADAREILEQHGAQEITVIVD